MGILLGETVNQRVPEKPAMAFDYCFEHHLPRRRDGVLSQERVILVRDSYEI